MKIVIAGAGSIGFHLAKKLSSQQQDIILIDSNQDVLDYAASHLDVLVIKGDSSSLEILKQAGVSDAGLFLAVTTFENTNIVSCILAKTLGAKQTIARISKSDLMSAEQKEVLKTLGIDKLIYPTELAAKEIVRLLELGTVTENFAFENGKISVIGITVTNESPVVGRTLKEINQLFPSLESRPIALLRGSTTIMPRSQTKLHHNDHVYFITLSDEVEELLEVVGKTPQKITNVMILGGTDLSYVTAKKLEEEYNITIVAESKSSCKHLTEILHNALIINGDPSNIELLKEEGMENMDAVIALTPNSETNIIASLMAEQIGVFKTVALVDNTDYTHISQHIGIDTIINKKLIAANNIFRFVRKGTIEAITSLHGVDAEIIEFVITKESRITSKPLRELKFPPNTIIGGIVRGEQSYIPDGDFQLANGDKVIVFAVSDSIDGLEKMFR